MAKKTDRQSLASNIAAARRAAALSQEDLAARIGVRANTISRWERGVASPNRIEDLRRLAAALGTTAAALLAE